MAGHSKWHNIKHKKAKEDAKKGLIFTKLSKEISVAVKHGGVDPSFNIPLRLLLEKAKENNMPKENVERAIKKGSGQLEGVNYESIMYEGYAPCNVAVIIEALTDNKNRTISDLRCYFSKHGGRMVDAGTVSWMFEKKGQIEIDAQGMSEEKLTDIFLETDINDIKMSDDSTFLISEMENVEVVREFAEKKGFKVKSASLIWMAKNNIELTSEDDKEKVMTFLENLDELDDVQTLFVNLE